VVKFGRVGIADEEIVHEREKDRAFPVGKKWIPDSDDDLAYHHVKSLVLDRPLYLWNKTTQNISSSKLTHATTNGTHTLSNTQTEPHQEKRKEHTIFF
jgi:hypothetical protein